MAASDLAAVARRGPGDAYCLHMVARESSWLSAYPAAEGNGIGVNSRGVEKLKFTLPTLPARANERTTGGALFAHGARQSRAHFGVVWRCPRPRLASGNITWLRLRLPRIY